MFTLILTDQVILRLEQVISPELDTKFQTAIDMFQAMTERFQEADREYNSYKAFLHEADSSSLRILDRDVRICVEHSHQTLTQNALKRVYTEIQHHARVSQDVWHNWKEFFSLLGELAVSNSSCIFLFAHDSANVLLCNKCFFPVIFLFRLQLSVKHRMTLGPEV